MSSLVGSNYFVCLQSYSIGLRDVNLSAVDAAILYDSDWDAQVGYPVYCIIDSVNQRVEPG